MYINNNKRIIWNIIMNGDPRSDLFRSQLAAMNQRIVKSLISRPDSTILTYDNSYTIVISSRSESK